MSLIFVLTTWALYPQLFRACALPPAPTPGHQRWQGRLPLREVPQDTPPLTRVHTAAAAEPARAGAHADAAAKTGSPVVMGKRGPVTSEAR